MFRRIFGFFTSVRLAIVLLIVLSVLSVIGTIVPQNIAEQEYLRIYREGTYQLLNSAGFTDMYHCWWFIGVLGLFSLNLAACSLSRLSRIRRLLRPADATPSQQQLQNMGNYKKISFKRAPAAGVLEQAVKNFMNASPVITRREDTTYIVAEKGRFSHLGFYLTHIGMIAIIAGVLIGIAGFQGFMKIDEGEIQSSITLKNTLQQRDLGFSIRCDRFEVSYYDQGRMPRDYKSWLTVIEDGKEIFKKVIEVNDPLIYRGIFFYQSSYGAASAAGGEVLLRIKPAGAAQAREYRVSRGRKFALEGTKDEAVVESILADFAMDNGKYFSRSDEPNNPAAHVIIYRGGSELESAWSFMKFPDFRRKADAAYEVQLADFYPRFYTGLQVTRDPGVNIVWLGCLLMIAGICMSFFMSHRRVWLVVTEDEGAVRAVLAASASKNRQAFASEFNRFFESLKSLEKQP